MQRRQAGSRHRVDGQDRRSGEARPGQQAADRVDHLVHAVRLDHAGLGHHGDAVADPERVEQREVLDRLRARPVVGRDDEHRGVDLARSDEHVPDQPVVAGDVDEVELDAVVEREMGVADVDGHPPSPLLGQPVRVDPGQGAEQGRLAVVDVAGGPDDDRHADPARARPTAAASSSSRAGSTVRRSSITRPVVDPADDDRGARAQRRREPWWPSGRRGRRPTTRASRRAASRRRPSSGSRSPWRADRSRDATRHRPFVQRISGCRDHPPDRDDLDGAAGAIQAEGQRRRPPASSCPGAWRGPAGRAASGR